MSEYEHIRTMQGLPEIVFDQASDPGRLDAWLPEGLYVRPDDLPAVTVHEDATGRDEPALYRAEPDRLRIEWKTRDGGGYTGWLQVDALDPGGSEVTIHLSFRDAAGQPPREAVDSALRESLDRLAEQVRLRVDGEPG
ncbi:SRPBCC family protein [Kitasatospora sp. CMC57]|uniref:SRPBCC family protein n=1 Tax=Kitasatospora sp. CMC57 TaxID=3231513 RepID=A0AB33JZ05_9ACTN